MPLKSIGFTDIFVKILLQNLPCYVSAFDLSTAKEIIQQASASHSRNSLESLFDISEKSSHKKRHIGSYQASFTMKSCEKQ